MKPTHLAENSLAAWTALGALLLLAVSTASARPPAEVGYSGRRISLDLHEALVGDVLHLFQEVSGREFVVEDDRIQGLTITIDVDSVPWDEVLDTIVRIHHLRTWTDGGAIHVGWSNAGEPSSAEGEAPKDVLVEAWVFRGSRDGGGGVRSEMLPVGAPFVVIDSDWVAGWTRLERSLEETFGLDHVDLLAAPKLLAQPGKRAEVSSQEDGNDLFALGVTAWPGGGRKLRLRFELAYRGVELYDSEVVATDGKPFVVGGRDPSTGDYVFLSLTTSLDKGRAVSLSEAVRVGSPGLPALERRGFVAPVYPSDMRKAGVEGLVVFDVTVGPSGKVEEVQVLKGDEEELVRAARDAVLQWTYAPPEVEGKPVRARMVVKVDFRLK